MDSWAVKRSTGRCWGFAVGSFGLWTLFWFHTYRRLLDGEMGQGRDDATLHTLGLLVPVLNFFVIYWLWRDLDLLRRHVGLPEFPVVPFVIGSLFISPLFYSLVNEHLNEYWDVRSQGYVTDAPVTGTEKVVTAVGAGLFLLYLLLMVLIVVLAFVAGSSSS